MATSYKVDMFNSTIPDPSLDKSTGREYLQKQKPIDITYLKWFVVNLTHQNITFSYKCKLECFPYKKVMNLFENCQFDPLPAVAFLAPMCTHHI